MRFQILLPTFNASRWFSQALSSVAGQPESEVIIIDDGSREDERDAVAQISRNFENVRFYAEPHRGLVGTLNFGLTLTTAPYIARMDADDISMPHRFAEQLAYLDNHPNVALVGGQMIGIDQDGVQDGRLSRYPTRPAELRKCLENGKNYFMHPSVMMRRDAVLAVGGYRAVTQYAEDYDLWLRLAERYDLANLANPVLYYRQHENQITSSINWNRKLARDLATLSARYRRLRQNDPISGILNPINLNKLNSSLPNEIATIVEAYQALHDNTDCIGNSNSAVRSIIHGIRSGLFGPGSRPKASAAVKATSLAWKSENYNLAIKAMIVGVRTNPVAYIRGLTSSI